VEAMVHLTGYAGTEVEIKGNGAVSKFRLACTPRVRSKGEWGDGNTTWIDVSCFRGLAEHVAASVRKGDPVVVVGRLRTNVWDQDGQSRSRLVIEAETVGHDLNRGTAVFRRPARSETDGRDIEPPDHDTESAGPPPEEQVPQAA
jgi:single-strand DNA-binding protein